MSRDASQPARPGPGQRQGRQATSAWQAAVLIVFAALVLAAVLPRVEVHEHWRPGFSYDPSTAQAALAAIAGGMLTLTGFAVAAVTLMVQTIQQQSPRLMAALYRTENLPVVFGTFIAAFAFSLIVLTDVRNNAVPTISVIVAILLALISVAFFLRLLVRFRSTLTTGGLARDLGRETRQAIDAQFTAPYQPAAAQPRPPAQAAAAPSWTIRHAGEPGVYQGVDEPAVLRLAEAADTEVTISPGVGDFVAAGTVIATGTGAQPAADQLAGAIWIAPARSLPPDPAFGIRLLADISIRALSPGVNDPTSAVQALDQLDDILRRLAGRSLGSGRITDSAGRCRIRFTPPGWEALVGLAVDETMQYGASSIQVARRLKALLEDLLAAAPEQRRPPVLARIDALSRLVTAAYPDAGAAEAAIPDRQGLGSPIPAQPSAASQPSRRQARSHRAMPGRRHPGSS